MRTWENIFARFAGNSNLNQEDHLTIVRGVGGVTIRGMISMTNGADSTVTQSVDIAKNTRQGKMKVQYHRKSSPIYSQVRRGSKEENETNQ